MADTLAESKLCNELGIPADRVRKYRLYQGLGKETAGQGKSLGLKPDDAAKVFLRWELRKYSGSMLDLAEQSEEVDFNQVGKRYSYLSRRTKRVKGAERLTLTSWKLTPKLPTPQEGDISLITIDLVAIKETVNRIFKRL
jgi:hypothetical protein